MDYNHARYEASGITTMIIFMQLDHFPPERNVLRTEGAEAEWNGKDG